MTSDQLKLNGQEHEQLQNLQLKAEHISIHGMTLLSFNTRSITVDVLSDSYIYMYHRTISPEGTHWKCQNNNLVIKPDGRRSGSVPNPFPPFAEGTTP
jgi:hypothetical protein